MQHSSASFDSIKGPAVSGRHQARCSSWNWAHTAPRASSSAAPRAALPCETAAEQKRRRSPSSTYSDVLVLVGPRRKAYCISAESLMRGSSYFRAWLQQLDIASNVSGREGRRDACTMVVDCEERMFEHVMSVMRYGTLEAVPANLPESDMLKLRKELRHFGIHYDTSSSLCCAPHSPSSACSSSSSSASASSSQSASPAGSSTRDAIRLAHARKSPRISPRCPWRLSDLPNFSPDLADPARLVLVSCSPDSMNEDAICHFCCSRGSGGQRSSATPNQWALSFAQRHAFCAECGRPPLHMPTKLFAEMFMAAASYYLVADDDAVARKRSPPSVAALMSSSKKWVVSRDSTCTLRFVEGPCCQRCVTSTPRAPEGSRDGVWAASAYFGQAFCASCGQAATGPALLSLLLAIRYGRVLRNSSS